MAANHPDKSVASARARSTKSTTQATTSTHKSKGKPQSKAPAARLKGDGTKLAKGNYPRVGPEARARRRANGGGLANAIKDGVHLAKQYFVSEDGRALLASTFELVAPHLLPGLERIEIPTRWLER